MGRDARIEYRRELTNEAKQHLVNSFLSGESIGEGALRLGVARVSVEEAVREAITGLAALNQRLRAPIVAYLDGRMRWNSGGPEGKSRAEGLADEQIVRELADVLDVVNGIAPSRAEGNEPWRQKVAGA